MRPVRLRNYIFYLLALTITLPLLVLSYSQYRMIEQEIRKDDLLLVEDALALSNNIKNRVDSAKTLVVMSASTLQVYGTEDKSALRAILKSILTEVPYFLNIHYGDVNGDVIVFEPPKNARNESNEGVSHTNRDHWSHIRNRDSVYISDVIMATGAANVPIVNICAPAINKSGKIIGYAVSALDLKSLYEDVVSGLDIQDSAVYILDKKGAPIYATDHVNSPEPLIPSKVLKELVANKENAQVLSRNDASDLVGAIREIPGLGWYVGVFKKEEDRESAIISMAATNSLIFFFLLLVTFILASYSVRPLTESVNKLIEQVREGKAVPTEAEKVHHPEELVELQKAFCRLLVKLKSHQKSEGALSELSESDVQKEVELLKEQYKFLQALITLLPSPMAIVDENGFVRFLNQSASKFFDKAVAGANFAQMLKEKFEEDNFGFNLHGMSEEKILKTKDTREDFLLQRRELPPIKGTRRSVYLLSPFKEPDWNSK